MTNSKHRVLIIGGGHNGLVCAAYLAKVPPVEHDRGLTYPQYACAALAPTTRNLGDSGARDHG